MNHFISKLHAFVGLGCLCLAGCAMMPPPTNVHQPMTARPQPLAEPPAANGAIYRVSYADKRFFEDRRARGVGDTLLININEKTNASKASDSSAERTGDTTLSVPALAGLPGKSFLNATLEASSSNTFEGKGEASSENDFTGTITVTVIEVMPNGNLVVSGEKQVGVNQGTEFIRFSGVVNPIDITAANAVTSTQVADARIEYKATGYIDEAQVMGWLARFFLTFLPF